MKKTAKTGRAKPRTATSKKPRGAYHHGDLRNTILDAAEIVLEEGGIESLSLRDAARRAGVSHAAPYRHFPAKLDLLYAIAERGFRALDAEMRRAGQSSADPVEQLEEAGFAYVRLAVHHPWRTQLMFGGVVSMNEAAASPELREIANSSFGGLVAIIAAGQATGAFVEQDALQQALAVWSLVHGTAMLVLGGQFRPAAQTNSDEELRSIVRIVHRMTMLGLVRDERRAELDSKMFLPDWTGMHAANHLPAGDSPRAVKTSSRYSSGHSPNRDRGP